ncbi:transcription termination/antitermination protein NusG [Neoehrlichia mikurensis]|uniref:Transcription termination/antitermination protein NusG n=1 Tax=Neoehrlichia mikurensis TaxID=89586 RepID=A0A9Q9BYV6_9RICK|nr:transcription termination/antitermination protein NusG [Neoehrlichia mikurensis]QXK92624.1 transcription termination/antitermination factor NusG [Neoehrlichia mikurensis]UTO55140.1 transcription termination/antitermination protein NusG [Neoehrlichia mikurensis]UTO56061.1 transcription termination/antitermination protein NusG [Neoehrlichia mikurensis]
MECSGDYKWYIIQVLSGNEERVSQVIIERAEQLGFANDFSEIFIPYEEVTKTKRNKKVIVKRKLLPGYVFLLMRLNNDTMTLIRTIPKVSNFLLSDDSGLPKVISFDEMASMRQKMHHGVIADDNKGIDFEVGDEVVVNDGLFQDFTGKVEYVDDDKEIAGVSVMIFGRLTKIEFKLQHIQKLEG